MIVPIFSNKTYCLKLYYTRARASNRRSALYSPLFRPLCRQAWGESHILLIQKGDSRKKMKERFN